MDFTTTRICVEPREDLLISIAQQVLVVDLKVMVIFLFPLKHLEKYIIQVIECNGLLLLLMMMQML